MLHGSAIPARSKSSLDLVPELTRNVGIKLNDRHWLKLLTRPLSYFGRAVAD
jgi:hypothetical protein